jgi:hypothetical protein
MVISCARSCCSEASCSHAKNVNNDKSVYTDGRLTLCYVTDGNSEIFFKATEV